MFARWIVLLVALIGLIGCGGGGSSGPSGRPALTIGWPARTKDNTVDSQLTSALSALVTVTSLSNQQTSTVAIDRNTAPAAYTEGYTCSKKLPLGQVHLSVKFYDEAGEQGSLVGDAETDCILSTVAGVLYNSSTNQPLVGVVPIGTVSKVVITDANSNPITTDSVVVGSTLQLSFLAYDSSGNLIAHVSDGSENFQSQSTTIATTTTTGLVTGVKAGTDLIGCGVDGVAASTPLTLTVVAAPVTPFATISWGARTRDVALTSAESMSITVTSGSQTSTGVANRNLTSLPAYTQTLTLGSAIQPGPVTVTAYFYDGPAQTGDLVGTYTNSTATLGAAGALLSVNQQQLTIDGQVPTITLVTLNQPPTLTVGQTYQLSFNCYDLNNNPIIYVTPGAASYTPQSGQSHITLAQPYGLISANSAGTQTITCTVDGVVSAPITVTVVN